MKINIEKAFLIIFILILSFYAIYFVSPSSDVYFHYNIAKEVFKDVSFLWRTDLSGWSYFVANQSPVFTNYPPLIYLILAGLMLVKLPLFLITILWIVAIGYFLYKIDAKAIPFLFLSFMFIRETAFNGYDIALVAVTLASFYFLIKKKIILSGVFAGIVPLIKSTGLFVVLSWLLYVIISERRNIFKRELIIAIFIMFLLATPFYLRNYLIVNDVILAVIGLSRDAYSRSVEFLKTEFQMKQPERFIWDSTGYYPLPIDLLFYIGLLFFIFNLIKTKKIESYSILIIIMAVAYFYFQLSGNLFFSIRHAIIIFPFLALEILKGIPIKYLKYSFIFCLAFFIYFSLNLPKYSFNRYSELITPVCNQIKSKIDYEPVYVNAFHNWFVIYKCDLNATIRNESKWTLDFDKGQLYLTNITGV